MYLPRSNSKLKATLHSWRDCRNLCHDQHQGFEGYTSRSGDSYHILIQHIYMAFAEDRWVLDLREWQWDFCKLNHIPTALPDVASSLDKINIPWYVTLVAIIPSYSLHMNIGIAVKAFFYVIKVRNHLSLRELVLDNQGYPDSISWESLRTELSLHWLRKNSSGGQQH